jgi:hypothetical protein
VEEGKKFEYIPFGEGEYTMSKSIFGLDKPVTKGDLWQAIAAVKIFEAKEKKQEEAMARIQSEHTRMGPGSFLDMFGNKSEEEETIDEELEKKEKREKKKEETLIKGCEEHRRFVENEEKMKTNRTNVYEENREDLVHKYKK